MLPYGVVLATSLEGLKGELIVDVLLWGSEAVCLGIPAAEKQKQKPLIAQRLASGVPTSLWLATKTQDAGLDRPFSLFFLQPLSTPILKIQNTWRDSYSLAHNSCERTDNAKSSLICVANVIYKSQNACTTPYLMLWNALPRKWMPLPAL